jgi:hypothetical protein
MVRAVSAVLGVPIATGQKTTTAKNGARIVVDKRSLWQRKALKGSRLRLLIWGVIAAFLVVEKQRSSPGLMFRGLAQRPQSEAAQSFLGLEPVSEP